MITKLFVDGFKSLSNFNLKFNKGLNVLIGPNGAGKTNICQAIGLLSSIADDSISSHILSIGGIASICRYEGVKKTKNKKVCKYIIVACEGIIPKEEKKLAFDIKYKYRCRFEIRETLKIKSEKLTIYRRLKGKDEFIFEAKKGKELAVKLKNFKIIGPISPFLEKLLKKRKKERPRKIEIKKPMIDNLLNELSGPFFIVYIIEQDLSESKTFNIDPYVAKQPSESIEADKMSQDGRRLSNALHHMFEHRKGDIRELNAFLKSIFSTFNKISPEISKDGFKRTFAIENNNGIKFYAYNLCDGAIKIIALMVGIFGMKNNTVIIEEPENYLHPWACQNLLNYLRDLFKNQVCILTTHSETILNLVKPSEIIVCQNAGGITNGRRLANAKKIKEIIKDTGFGCGYHYISGSLGGIPL